MRPDRDIDLPVEFMPEAEVSLWMHVALERELSELFGRKVDLVTKRGLRESIRAEVLTAARLIYFMRRDRL